MSVPVDLGRFAPGFDSWQRVMAQAENSAARLNVFSNAADEVASYIARGLDRTVAADKLMQIGSAYGLTDQDAMQWIMARAFASPNRRLLPAPQQLDERPEPPASNGHDTSAVEIPVCYPFPIDGSLIPRRPWVVPGLLLRKQVTVLVAPAGSGKSLLSLQIALMCSSQMNWNGWRPRGKFRLLIINAEEDSDEQRRRLFAAREFMAVPESDLGGLAFAENPETIIIAHADARTRTVTRTPMLERIVTTIITQHMDIIVVDPFAETFAGDENSNSELKWAAMLWREVARRTNAAVMLIHHTRKYAHEPGDPDVGRGASALTGVARIVATLFTMSEEEAKACSIKPLEDRVRYIRFDDAKANLSLLSFNARWFQKQSVILPNAGDDGEPADEVGVLREWTPPDVLAGLASSQVCAILDGLREGMLDAEGHPTGDPYTLKNSAGGARWAGQVIQRHHECTDDEAKRILSLWVRNGMLEEVSVATSNSHGKVRKGLRVVGQPGVLE
jgi:hypothetical protein